LRIPGWAEGATVSVNGKLHDGAVSAGSYVRFSRNWSAGDEIVLNLPMDVRLMLANPKVEAARNQVAVMRGPIVYCLESPDLPKGVRICDVVIPRDIQLKPRFDRLLLGGLTVLDGQAEVYRTGDWSGRLYKPLGSAGPEKIKLRLIPYYAWANRGISEMSVWLPVR